MWSAVSCKSFNRDCWPKMILNILSKLKYLYFFWKNKNKWARNGNYCNSFIEKNWSYIISGDTTTNHTTINKYNFYEYNKLIDIKYILRVHSYKLGTVWTTMNVIETKFFKNIRWQLIERRRRFKDCICLDIYVFFS